MIILDENDTPVIIEYWEKTEQEVAQKYVCADDCVLELGARYGSVSCKTNFNLKNKTNHVVVEPDERVWNALEKNKQINNCQFHIVKGFISNKKLSLTNLNECHGYGTTFCEYNENDKLIPHYSLDEIKQLYKIPKFNFLIADCEGYLEEFLNTYPYLYDELEKIFFEKDGPEKCNYDLIIKNFMDRGFKVIYNSPHHMLLQTKQIYHSQCQQDKFLEENIFNGFKNGFFVDVGANDGVTINNTLFFENERNWTGINIEPLPQAFEKLKQNRPKCKNLNFAICNENGVANFVCNEGYTEMLSGLENTYDERHHQRRERENQEHGSSTNVIQVKTKKLADIFGENKVKHVHYLTIDVEGAEFEVIKSINFKKVFIDVIEFEANYDNSAMPIINYLFDKGYVFISKEFDIMMIHRDSRFFKNLKKN